MQQSYLNYINGVWGPALNGQSITCYCPSNAQPIATIPASSAEDIDAAVKAARNCFDSHVWTRMTATDRGRLLSLLGKEINNRVETLSALESMDTGKPLSQARNDIISAARYFEFYGGAADKIGGETLPYLNDYQVMLLREPLGVTGHIIPWNYPAQMFGRTLAPALAMGNTVVLKPAEDACLTPLVMTKIAEEVGFPAGVINLVCGLGPDAGSALASHPEIDFLSFTGSPEVGAHVQSLTAQNHIACTLELGGKSPQIIFTDADLDAAIPIITRAIIQNSGQTCSAGSRVLIQKGIFDTVIDKLKDNFKTLIAGSHDQDCDLGPLISAKQKERVEAYLAHVPPEFILAQGTIDSQASPSGFFYPPTLIGPLEPNHQLSQEEIFGPVLVVLEFNDEDEAIRLANGTRYGLVSGVWTRDGSRQIRMAKQLRCGQVFINCYGAGGGVELPFGGTKKSGHGREKGLAALLEFSQIKTVVQYIG